MCDRTALITDEVIRRDICWRREYSINTNHSHFTQIITVSVSCHYASFLYLSIIGTDSNKGNVGLYSIHSLWDCWRVWIESIIVWNSYDWIWRRWVIISLHTNLNILFNIISWRWVGILCNANDSNITSASPQLMIGRSLYTYIQ